MFQHLKKICSAYLTLVFVGETMAAVSKATAPLGEATAATHIGHPHHHHVDIVVVDVKIVVIVVVVVIVVIIVVVIVVALHSSRDVN